jgi:hypothetical protein
VGRLEARWSGLPWGAKAVVLAALIPGACSGQPAAVRPTASAAATATSASTATVAPASPTATSLADAAGAPGGKGTLSPMFATTDLARLADGPQPVPTTPYVSYPDAFSAQCHTSGDATWLQITRTGPSGAAPALAGSEGPTWGLHDFDVAVGLGNLIELIRTQAAAFGR